MKLKCVLVFALFHLVAGTPYGYGVKGGAGAAAKADAAAGAGAFVGVPLAIPSGAGYSGSFAKSSSSSFAASSASSSASSFSFSGSGTLGASGLTGAGANGAGTAGCNENCKSGNNIIPDTTGAGTNNQAFGGAKAAATAGAVAISGAPYGKNGNQLACPSGDCTHTKSSDCVGSNCGGTSNNSDQCTSGKCEPIPQVSVTNEKCTAGQCSPSSYQSAPSYDSDDIQVNIDSAGSKSLLNSQDQSVKYNKNPDYEPLESSPSTPYKPTTYLTTPKKDSPCTSPDCAPISSFSGLDYAKEKPSSYNVPILGPNYGTSTQNKELCSTGNCQNSQPVIPHTNLPSGPSRPGICASGNCQTYPYNQLNPGSPVVPSGYEPISLSGVPTAGPLTVAKNHSYAQPIAPHNSVFVNTGVTAGVNAESNYGSPNPTTASTTQKRPPYTGGFGGPAGFLKPNDFNAPDKTPVSSYKPIPSTGSHTPAPCTSGNCASRPTQQEANIPTCTNGNCGLKTPVFTSGNLNAQASSQPSACSYGNCGMLPVPTPVQHSPPVASNPNTQTSTGIFGAPAGILKPNDYSKPSVPSHKPVQACYSPPSFPSVQLDQTNEPSIVQHRPVDNPSTCSSGNCGSQPTSSGPYIPSGAVTSNTPISIGFGGPAGILKPNDFNKPFIPSYKPTPAAEGTYTNPHGLPSPQHDQFNEPAVQNKPAGSSGPTPCSSGNCAYKPSQPEIGPAATAQTYPTLCPSGKCGPQPGQTSTVPPGSYNAAYCTSGNCGTKTQLPPVPSAPKNPSSPGLNQPGISGSYHSTFQSSPSSQSYGQINSLSQTHISTGAPATGSLNPSCSFGKCGPEQPSPQYGSVDTKHSSSVNTYNAQPCASGNCVTLGQNPNVPSASAGALSPAICTSGNCGVNSLPGHSSPHYSRPSASHIAVGAAASASAIAYNGGFGGPPGLLKPYDGGKLNSASNAGFSSKTPLGTASYGPTFQPAYGKSINGAGSLLSGAGAQASAIAGTGAAAGAYGENKNGGGGSGSLKDGCTNGCGSQGGLHFGLNGGPDGFGALSAAGASAKTVAGAIAGGGAGAYGQAGSFASSSASAHASAGAATKGGYGR